MWQQRKIFASQPLRIDTKNWFTIYRAYR